MEDYTAESIQNNETLLKRASRHLNTFSGIENLKKACRESCSFDKEKVLNRKARNALVDLLVKDMITEYNR